MVEGREGGDAEGGRVGQAAADHVTYVVEELVHPVVPVVDLRLAQPHLQQLEGAQNIGQRLTGPGQREQGYSK